MLDKAPASENSATQSGRVAIQKCPLARTIFGIVPCNTIGPGHKRARDLPGTARRPWRCDVRMVQVKTKNARSGTGRAFGTFGWRA